MNGSRLTFSNEQTYGLAKDVAAGQIEDVTGIADRLVGAIDRR